MKKNIIDINEMSDSKELYGQRPNPFVAIFIYSLVALLTVGIAFSCYMKIDIVSTASGVIRPNQNISTVTSVLSGKITSINVFDGKYVEKGDILLSIDVSDDIITLDSLKESQEKYTKQISMIDKYISGIKKNENPFSNETNSDEYPFYIDCSNYLLSVESSKNNNEYNLDKVESEIASINSQISTLEYKKAGLSAYITSIENDSDFVKEFPEYENMYLLFKQTQSTAKKEYEAECEKVKYDNSIVYNEYYMDYYQNLITEYTYLIDSINNGESVFPAESAGFCKLLYEDYCFTVKEYESQNYDTNTLNSFKAKKLADYMSTVEQYKDKLSEFKMSTDYTVDKESRISELTKTFNSTIEQLKLKAISEANTLLQSIETELLSAKSNLNVCSVTIEYYQNNKDNEGNPITISLDSIQKISQLLTEKETAEAKINELTTQIKQLESKINQGDIKAECSGIVCSNVLPSIGDTITSGMSIATIIPGTETEYCVSLYLKNSDIAKINVGDDVKLNILALPSIQYGFAEGTITKKYSDTIVQDGNYSGYYLAESAINRTTLTDKNGNIGTVSVGMQVEAKIVTERKTIIQYLLEKINIF